MYKTLSSRTVFVHPRLTVVEDEVELSDGQTGDYLWFSGNRNAVGLIARRPDGRILIQQEYSYLPGTRLYQLPGGAMEAGETPEGAANREFQEEAGLHANRLTLIGTYLLDHRRSHGHMYIFLCEDLTERTPAHKDKYEVDLQNDWLAFEDVEALIQQHKVVNIHLLASWTLYRSFLQESQET
jgi:8-oxo-dGTP pyrophosphatase MutT (NUDIX family)